MAELLERLANRISYRIALGSTAQAIAEDILSIVTHGAPAMTEPSGRAPVSNEELSEWAENRADDAGRLARELIQFRKNATASLFPTEAHDAKLKEALARIRMIAATDAAFGQTPGAGMRRFAEIFYIADDVLAALTDAGREALKAEDGRHG